MATLGLFSAGCSIDTNSNGLFDSPGFNLVGDPGECAFSATGDQTGVDTGNTVAWSVTLPWQTPGVAPSNQSSA